MGENSAIQWTHHTFNPWIGCTRVSPGCTNCYAEYLMDKRYGKAKWGPSGTRVMTTPDYWSKPIKWNAEAKAAGERRRVFCASLADVFESWNFQVSGARGLLWLHWETEHIVHAATRPHPKTMRLRLDHVRAMLFGLVDKTPWLDWMFLTKRIENVRRMWHGGPRKNIWIGTTIENQAAANERMLHLALLADLTPCLFVSAEPLLERVALPLRFDRSGRDVSNLFGLWDESDTRIGLVIAGFESDQGAKARGCDLDAITFLIEQCETHRVACFVKQLGSDWARRMSLKDKHGGDPSEWPQEFRVRQMPEVFA